MYYIYHIPSFVRDNGKIGKIGVSDEPIFRVNKQGYDDFEILEVHTDIFVVSDREIELQKQYGYPVDRVPYHVSRGKWGSKAGKSSGKSAVEDGRINKLSIQRMKPLLQFTKDGKFIKEWECGEYAGIELKIAPQNIRHCVKGRRKTAGGFIWKYKN